MYAKISGMGKWLPKKIRYNNDWSSDFAGQSKKTSDEFKILSNVPTIASDVPEKFKHIIVKYSSNDVNDPFFGSVERRVASEGETSVFAETEAGREAIKNAQVDPGEIDVVLSWSMVPEFLMPSNASKVAGNLEIKNAWASAIDGACVSPLIQLQLAKSLIESGHAKNVLLTQSHLLSRTFPLEHPASPGIGDGATALLVSTSGTQHIDVHCVTHGEFSDAIVWRRRDVNSHWWKAGDDFYMGSCSKKKTKYLIENTIPIAVKTIHELLTTTNKKTNDVDLLACIQPRWWLPIALAEALEIDTNKAPSSFKRYAHLAGTGAIMNMIEARETGKISLGSTVVLYAQGAGFTRGAALVKI